MNGIRRCSKQPFSRSPLDLFVGSAGVDREVGVEIADHPRPFEGSVSEEPPQQIAAPDTDPRQGFGHEDRSPALSEIVDVGEIEEGLVRKRLARAGDEDLTLIDAVFELEDLADKRAHLANVHVGDGGGAPAADDVAVPDLRQPGFEKNVERRVLAPVREEGREADDARRDVLVVLGQHLLADPFGDRVDMLAVGGTVLGQHLARLRESTRRHGRAEDQALQIEVSTLLEHIAHALDVCSPVLGVLFAGEIVVRCEMNDVVGAAGLADIAKGGAQGLAVSDVHLVPGDVLVDGRAAVELRSTGEADDPEILLEELEEMPSDESGSAGDDETRQFHPARHCTHHSVVISIDPTSIQSHEILSYDF